jgi:hypothetical protein
MQCWSVSCRRCRWCRAGGACGVAPLREVLECPGAAKGYRSELAGSPRRGRVETPRVAAPEQEALSNGVCTLSVDGAKGSLTIAALCSRQGPCEGKNSRSFLKASRALLSSPPISATHAVWCSATRRCCSSMLATRISHACCLELLRSAHCPALPGSHSSSTMSSQRALRAETSNGGAQQLIAGPIAALDEAAVPGDEAGSAAAA